MSTAPLTASPAAPRHPLVRPELLAPAGDWECARAAVENGADAIYFGLERFNARMRAKNFTVAALPKLLTWCAPLVITGGRFVAMKGADVESDEGAAAKQGLVLERQLSLTLADPEQSQRTLLVYRKQGGG